MISEFITNDLVRFHEKFDNWEDAVYASCESFIENGYINEAYRQSIIDNIHEHGPYIIIAPDIAMPHSTQGAEGIYKTGISFMKVEEEVSFLEGDETKNARLFFTLAAKDPEQHMENIQNLMELLMNDELLSELKEVKSIEELKIIATKYNK